MAVIIFVYHLLVSYIGESLWLRRVPAKARVVIEGTFAQSLYVVGLTVIQIVLAVIAIQGGCALEWRFHFRA